MWSSGCGFRPGNFSWEVGNYEKNHLLVNEKGDVGMAKRFSKSTETRDDLSTTSNLNKGYVNMPVSA